MLKHLQLLSIISYKVIRDSKTNNKICLRLDALRQDYCI